ncbi:MAG TPA: ChuX/HutX family heme-like substrate-binding protein [Prosthecobacter sp.]
MEHLHPNRIAFSFVQGTFDIDRMKPVLWEVEEDTASAHVQLDARWERLLPALSNVGVLMACATSGPATVAVALDSAFFEPVPNSADWVCLESGMEICPANLGGIIAAIEGLEGGQETASLQFFDRNGDGCLKLMATNRTDIAAFEALVRRHAGGRHTAHFGTPVTPSSPGEGTTPDARTVRSLWDGLRRTLPETSFPGLEGVSRRRALAVAGPEHAWQVRTTSVHSLMRVMTLADAPLGVGLRNEAVFLPVGMYPSHWNDCACGTTFFSTAAQVTLRHLIHQSETWVTRFIVKSREVLCLELYDKQGRFCAGVGLRPEATHAQQEQWNDWLHRAEEGASG